MIVGAGVRGRAQLRAWAHEVGADRVALYRATAPVTDEAGVREVTGDLEACLADLAPEWVAVCCPTREHESVALAALRAGAHVLVEAPLANRPEGGAEFVFTLPVNKRKEA